MKLTIVKSAGVVGVDGVFRNVDLSELSEDIHAVQWNGETGHIELIDGGNVALEDIDEFQPFIDLWTAAAPVEHVPTPAENIAAAYLRIIVAYETAIGVLIQGAPSSEIVIWSQLLADAHAWQVDNSAPALWLRGLATGQGLPVAEAAVQIITRVEALAPTYGELTGKRIKLAAAIKALGDSATKEQLDAIQW